MYNIQSEQDYQQRIIPPSPERPSSPPVRSALLSRWGPSSMSLLETYAASLSASQGILFCSSMLQPGSMLLCSSTGMSDLVYKLCLMLTWKAQPWFSCPTQHGKQQGWPQAVLTSAECCRKCMNTSAVTCSRGRQQWVKTSLLSSRVTLPSCNA